MSYPDTGESEKTGVARIPKGQLDAIKKFLETEEAREMGYTSITSFVEDAVRRRLEFYRYPLLDETTDDEQHP